MQLKYTNISTNEEEKQNFPYSLFSFCPSSGPYYGIIKTYTELVKKFEFLSLF